MRGLVDASAHWEGNRLGAESRVLAHAHVGPGVVIGERCTLHEHALLHGAVRLADDVEVQRAAQLLGTIDVEEGVTIGPGAVLANAWRIDSKGHDVVAIRIRAGASIGANATVLAGVEIGCGAVVEAGAIVSESVPANAVASGNPATTVACVEGKQPISPRRLAGGAVGRPVKATRVPGVTLHPLTHARDLRGSLTAAEFAGLPFVPRRLFIVHDVPSEFVRGAHAHRRCSQLLICMQGALSCLVDNGETRDEISLDGPEIGLHIAPMIWGTQWRYTRDALLLVLASDPYDPADYVRDYEEFLELIALQARSRPA